VRYNIDQANKTERFISIKESHQGVTQIHIYRYDKKQLIIVGTVYTCNDGYNPIIFHDEPPFNNVKTIKEAINILKEKDLSVDLGGEIGILSNNEAYKLLCQ